MAVSYSCNVMVSLLAIWMGHDKLGKLGKPEPGCFLTETDFTFIGSVMASLLTKLSTCTCKQKQNIKMFLYVNLQ